MHLICLKARSREGDVETFHPKSNFYTVYFPHRKNISFLSLSSTGDSYAVDRNVWLFQTFFHIRPVMKILLVQCQKSREKPRKLRKRQIFQTRHSWQLIISENFNSKWSLARIVIIYARIVLKANYLLIFPIQESFKHFVICEKRAFQLTPTFTFTGSSIYW